VHTLLLADDSVTIQRVIELTFADEDIRVIAVSDGAQAVRQAQAERPDIVLADVGMPEMDGYEVAAFIKGTPALSHIPVLLLTGAFEPIDEDRARAVGCDGVLVKPFEPQMVISRVKDLIAGRRQSPTTAVRTDFLVPTAAQPPAFTPPEPATDEYFDRLDAALANFDATAATTPQAAAASAPAPSASAPAPSASVPAPSASAPPPSASVPAPSTSVPAPSASAPAPSASAPAPSASAPAPSTSVPSPLVEAFEALLAAEQGRPLDSTAAQTLASSETLIDHITRQVIARVADTRMRDVVLEVAERLVREEIDRIKSRAAN
jgi:CheY-like chemotaxis protein